MSSVARIRFHSSLIPLLSRNQRHDEICYRFRDTPSVKDAIEACGIPHTEVDVILVNGASVAFDERLFDGARVEVYPFGCLPDIAPVVHLCAPLTDRATFILDVHLGKLARRLRMLGFDCRYSNHCDDPDLIRMALAEERIILTRDRGILKHARVRQGLLIHSGQADEQVREVLLRYRLSGQITPLQRCPSCNGLLHPAVKAAIIHRLLPRTARYYEEFYQCRDCGKLYWQGSHYHRIARWIEEMQEFSCGQEGGISVGADRRPAG